MKNNSNKVSSTKAGSRPTYATSVAMVLKTVESAESAKAAESDKKVPDPAGGKAAAVLSDSEASHESDNS